MEQRFVKKCQKCIKKQKGNLEEIKEDTEQTTHDLLILLADILVDFQEINPAKKLLHRVIGKLDDNGGAEKLHADCEQAVACNSKNHLH